MPADEAAVPGEHGLGRDQERAPPFTGDEASEQGDERPIGPGEAGPPDLAAEHCQLVAQDENLSASLATSPKWCARTSSRTRRRRRYRNDKATGEHIGRTRLSWSGTRC